MGFVWTLCGTARVAWVAVRLCAALVEPWTRGAAFACRTGRKPPMPIILWLLGVPLVVVLLLMLTGFV
jgi:hypothetical protein